MAENGGKRGEAEKTRKANEPVKAGKAKAAAAPTKAPSKPRTEKKPTASKAPSRIAGKTAAFALHAPQATKVFVAGCFNDWNQVATPLERDEAGSWKCAVTLAPGQYEYRFVVDGEWCDDPLNSMLSSNEMGTQNCILIVEE